MNPFLSGRCGEIGVYQTREVLNCRHTGFIPFTELTSCVLHLVKGLLNNFKEVVPGKRFPDEVQSLINHTPVSNNIRRVTGHEQALHVREGR